MARCLAERGATVVLAARREKRIADLAAELPGAEARTCDIADTAAGTALVDGVVADHGRIDVLVNNAGTSAIGSAEDEDPDTFAQVVHTNLVATFALSRAAGRHMIAGDGGSIVNVASIFGLVGSGRLPQASYSASKAGVVNLTRELGAQWARRGVRVNAIAPAFFDTEMTAGMFGDERAEAWMRRTTPMGRAGELSELHGALVFLASDASSYVTGTTIAVDGGWTAV
jgi:NAD(P)-dependent dehydrogenase (short-subunit alcohol dehydrogenase family)